MIGDNEKLVGLIEKLRCAYKTQMPFSYKKPLGFVNDVKIFDGVKLFDNNEYGQVSLVLHDDIDNCLPSKVNVKTVSGKYSISFKDFLLVIKDKVAADNLVKYLFNTPESDWVTLTAKQLGRLTNALNSSDKNEDKIINELYALSSCSYSEMSLSTRQKSLAVMADQIFKPGWNEQIIIDLTKSVLDNPDDAKKLYAYFEQNPKVLYELYQGMDDNRPRFVEICTALAAISWSEAKLDRLPADRYYITGSDKLFVRSSYDKTKGIDIWSKWNVTFEMITETKELFPLEPVGLSDPCTNCSETTIRYLPAIFVQSLTDQSDEEGVETAINIALIFAGGYGSVSLIAKGPRIAKIIGSIELLNLTADGIITSPLVRNQLMQSENGKEFLKYWPYVRMGIDLATVSTDILTSFVKNGRKVESIVSKLPDEDAQKVLSRINEAEEVLKRSGNLAGSLSKADILISKLSSELQDFSTKFKLAGKIEVLPDGTTLVLKADNGDELGRLINNKLEITNEQIVKIKKGHRPNPSLYMSEADFANHLNKFNNEGAGFIVIKSWTEGGNPKYVSMPARKFVGLRSEMDGVISKYKAQGNDWKILRDELNLGSSTNLSNEEIFYVKISPSDSRFSFDMPNGNEGGAIPGEWIPRGKTGNGTSEAALLGSENVVHNKNIQQLLDYFGEGNWEKIR